MKLPSFEHVKICLITPPSVDSSESFYLKIEEALSEGIQAIQFRYKRLSRREAFQISRRLREITRRHQSLYIVNDEIDLALASDADGVHIGQQDFPLEWTRKLVGPDKVIGVSAHDLKQAVEAESGGADYIGFGSIFSTATKKDVREVGLESLKKIARNISIPVIAIGGISCSNLLSVFRSGATGVAVISAVWDHDDVRGQVRILNDEVKKADSIY